MKAKFIKGTTWRGKLVDVGDILDLDEKDYHNFVKIWKDAVPYAEPAPTPAQAVPSEPSDEPKKGKK